MPIQRPNTILKILFQIFPISQYLKVLTGNVKRSQNRGFGVRKTLRLLANLPEPLIHKFGDPFNLRFAFLASDKVLLIQDFDSDRLFQL